MSSTEINSAHRILVIDDDQSIRDLIALALEDDGFEVIGAPEGESALALIPEFKPAVILVDNRMPVMDGREFAERYRQLDECEAALIVLTAVDDPGKAAADVGADGYLAKPFDLADLSMVVNRFLPSKN